MPHHFGTMKLKGKGMPFVPAPIAKFIPSPTMPTYMPSIPHTGMTSDAIKRLEALRPKPLQKPNIKFNL